MKAFCVASIHPDPELRADQGVLRSAALTVTVDARLLAERIVQQAHAEAQALLEGARIEAQQVVEAEQQKAFQQADHLLRTLKHANESFLDRAQDTIVELAQALFNRLVMDTAPQAQIEAAMRRIRQEAPAKLAGALLRVHPDDFELVPEAEWEVKADPSVSRGTCCLGADSGEWQADFNAGVNALRSAFEETVRATGEGTDSA